MTSYWRVLAKYWEPPSPSAPLPTHSLYYTVDGLMLPKVHRWWLVNFLDVPWCASGGNCTKGLHITYTIKKFTSQIDGFNYVHFSLKVITSDIKVFYDLLMLYVRRNYLLRQVAWHSNHMALMWTSGTFCPSTVYRGVDGSKNFFILLSVFCTKMHDSFPRKKIMHSKKGKRLLACVAMYYLAWIQQFWVVYQGLNARVLFFYSGYGGSF